MTLMKEYKLQAFLTQVLTFLNVQNCFFLVLLNFQKCQNIIGCAGSLRALTIAGAAI